MSCDSGSACSTNMATIHLMAGDLAGAYREVLPGAQAGDPASVALIIDICERAGDQARASEWRERLRAVR